MSIGLLGITSIGILSPNDKRSSLGVEMSYAQALENIDMAYDTLGANYEFFENATSTYAKAIDYSWPLELTRIPATDNWILNLLSYFDWLFIDLSFSTVPTLFSEYQSMDYRRGFRRGYGICSQNAVAFVDLLEERYGIKARVVALEGHVVMEVEGTTTHDPSIGLSFPFAVSEAPDHLSRLASDYANIGHGELAASFDAAGNMYKAYGARGFRPKVYWVEWASDYLKWLLPIIGIGIGFLCLRYATKHD